MDKIKLNITGLSYSPTHQEAYALLLTEQGEMQRQLPIVIGKSEAQSIAIHLEGGVSKRPLSHDLMKMIIDTLQGEVVEVNIVKLVAGVFYAEICLVKDTHIFRIDARVSDAIALAVRFNVAIFTTSEIMSQASYTDSKEEKTQEEKPQGNTFDEYTIQQLEMLIAEAVREENYERAGELKREIEKREQ